MNQVLEKGDIVALKNGREVEVLTVKPDYEREGAVLRFDYIDRSEASPMRRTAYPSEINRVLRKNPRPAPDPKAQRPYDTPIAEPTKVIIVNGEEFVPKGPGTASKDPGKIINPAAQTQVHQAVTAPAKPVTSRIKKANSKPAVSQS